MSGNGKRPPRRRNLMSDDDLALWELVASSVEPSRGKPRIGDVEPPHDIGRPRVTNGTGSRPKQARPASSPAATPPPPSLPARASRTAPEPKPVVLERRKARRIARGADEIEARLDLHGMTQDDAHSALLGFIRRCHASGLRNVLVITGKGGPGRRRDTDDDVISNRPYGVLRRNVPRWLAGAEIGALVVSYSTAHIRHGGDGALYVRLRRADKPRA